MSSSFEQNSHTVAYVVSQELIKISSLLPSNKNRSFLVHALISAFRLSSLEAPQGHKLLQFLRPVPASFKDLSVYHSRDYLEHVLDADQSSGSDVSAVVTAEFGLEDDCPSFKGLPDYVQLVAGASLSAASVLRQQKADIAICWDGGRHHAQKSHASGFCCVADCVLVILALKRPIPTSSGISSLAPCTRKPRIMYLDLDLHSSDAVSQAFHSTNSSSSPQVLTFSIHHMAPGFFPVSPFSELSSVSSSMFDPFSHSLPLRQGASNQTFARIWPIVERARDIFEPDYVVVQCGVDGLAGDPCATWNWSLGGGDGSMGWCIDRIIKEWPGKKLLLGGGGYNSPNAARAWTYLTSIAIKQPLSLDAQIPDHEAFPLYGHSFTLDVPAGNMQDRNTDEYLAAVESGFDNIFIAMRERMSKP